MTLNSTGNSLSAIKGERFKKWMDSQFPTISRFAGGLVWLVDQRGRRSRRQLRALHDRHKGERCFIIGNGPSLREMNMRLLANEITFSLNRGYLYYDRIGSPCTYQVVVNRLVVEQWADEIAQLPNIKFVAWGKRHWFNPSTDIVYIGGPSLSSTPRFSTDISKDLWSGATVTYAALQLAYYLGFHQVILIGVDHRFRTKGTPHKIVTSSGDDINHFDTGYFGKGTRWQLPDLATSELAYALARYYYQQDGREILDATVDGALRIFPKVSYERLFPS